MPEYYDINKIRCLYCKHLWILASDESIDKELQEAWVAQTLIEHQIFHAEWEEKNER